MSGRIVNLETSAHQAVQELLPWFVMNRLEGGELDAVREHLAGCEQCRADVEQQRKLRAAEPDTIIMPDIDAAWRRMQAQLDAAPTAAESTAAAPRKRQSRYGNRLADAVQRLFGRPGGWMPWAMAAQFVAIAGLAIVVAHLEGESAAYRDASFHVLGTPKNASANIMAVFRPEATEQELRGVLQASGARIVDGPTATGAYLLRVDEAHIEPAIKALRAQRAVALVESLAAGAAR